MTRLLARELALRASKSPVVVVTGPRQSGKTTLVRGTFPDVPYENLEAPDVRERALSDPRGFLGGFPHGAVLDEVQRAPDLLSYIQVDVDGRRQAGRWILTGSQNLLLISSVAQSLAGRASILELLPLSLAELRAAGWLGEGPFDVLFHGGYPAPFDRGEDRRGWLGDYVRTYVERDVRQMLAISDLLAFQTFLRMAATRTGQLLNLSELGADAGISHNTARSWIGVLEASYVVTRIPPFFRNIGKRLVKTPKLHFLDTGLACYLLGIRSAEELRAHPLRGPLFESWVVSEVSKARLNRGLAPDLSFFRDAHGLEVDLLVARARGTAAIEAKSGATVPVSAFAPLHAVADLVPEVRDRWIVHGGDRSFSHEGARAITYGEIDLLDLGDSPPAAPRRPHGRAPRAKSRGPRRK